MKKKTFYGILALILAAAIVIICGIGSAVNGKWFKNKDVQTWFNSWGQNKDSASKPSGEAWGGVVDGDGNAMNNVATYAMPAAMAFYSEVATNSDIAAYSDIVVNITATYNFEYNNIAVDWSAEYASGASAADVLTITPDGDGSLNVAVSCAAPFSTQIILKATSRDNPEVFATTTVDYVKRIQNITNALSNTSGTLIINTSDDSSRVTFNAEFGEGSKYGEIFVSRFEMFLHGTMENNYLDRLVNPHSYNIKNYVLGNITMSSNDNGFYCSNDEVIDWRVSNFIHNYETADSAHKQAVDYALYNAYKQYKADRPTRGNMSIQMTVQVKVNGAVIQEYNAGSLVSMCYYSGAFGAENLSPVININSNVNL